MDKLPSQYNMLARKALVAAESGEAEKFAGMFTGRQPEEINEALSDLSQARYNDVLGNVWFTPLIAGAWYGHIDVIKVLREEYDVSIEQTGYIIFDGKRRKVTALCAAIRQQNFEVAQFLLDIGADINFCCPLGIACYQRDLTSVRFLIENNVDINGKDDDGLTCLMLACERYSLYVVRALLNKGAVTRIVDADGNTALHRLALKKRMYVLKNGPLPQIIDSLVNAGAMMSENPAGQTPLAAACASGNVEVACAIMKLPEVRPEEQLTAQEKLRKFENDMIEKRSAEENGHIAAKELSLSEKFKNPNELRKVKLSKKKLKNGVSEKVEEFAKDDEGLSNEI